MTSSIIRISTALTATRILLALMLLALVAAPAVIIPAQTDAQTQSTDATLSGITVNGTAVPGFDSDRTTYEYGIMHTTHQVTIAATTTDSAASWAVTSLADASTDAGHQVNLSAGRNTVTIRGTAEDSSTQDYTLNVNRGVSADFGWKAVDDFDTLVAAGNTFALGVWSDGTTMWVADDDDNKLYAYTLSSKARDSDKDIDLHSDNTNPWGIWSDGTTIWVVDTHDRKLYAYTLATKARDDTKDIDLHTENANPGGIWSDGTTIWVTNQASPKLYAYTLATKARAATKEFNTHSENRFPNGVWRTVQQSGSRTSMTESLRTGCRTNHDIQAGNSRHWPAQATDFPLVSGLTAPPSGLLIETTTSSMPTRYPARRGIPARKFLLPQTTPIPPASGPTA